MTASVNEEVKQEPCDEFKAEGMTMSSEKRRVRRRTAPPLRDENAPKQARNAYQVFMADNRRTIVEAHPNASMLDVSKLLGQSWKQLDDAKRQKYQELANEEKEKYKTDVEEYRKSEKYRDFQKRKRDHDKQNEKLKRMTSSDVPIYSETFLKHNRERETELRELRRTAKRLADEESQLDQHLGRLESAIEHMYTAIDESERMQQGYAAQMNTLLEKLLPLVANLPLPTDGQKPTAESLSDYVVEARRICESGSYPLFAAKFNDACKKS